MNEYRNIRSTPMYGALFCGAVVVLIGLYHLVIDKELHGLTLPGGRGSSRTWEPVSISGIGLILVGVGICCYPAYVLLKKSDQKDQS